MTTLFGFQLFGTCFVPLAVGVVTVFLLLKFVQPLRSHHNARFAKDELQKQNYVDNSSALLSMSNPKEKKVRKSKKTDSCCSKKDGKTGACSKKNRVIESTKVFLDSQSVISQELERLLSSQLASLKLPSESIKYMGLDSKALLKHCDGSLCIFILDVSVVNGHHKWLQEDPIEFQSGDKPLAGMKYAAFSIESMPSNGSKLDMGIDQWLHKLGAVRAFKAASVDPSVSHPESKFGSWVDELMSQIEKWNAPKSKSCKCGPKEKGNHSDQEQNKSCSSGSSCSGSDEEEGAVGNAVKTVLDLEDIAKIL